MDYVVLDTDVAWLSFRRRLSASIMAAIGAKPWCLGFVIVAEMTQWASLRSWSLRNQGALDAWLSDRVFRSTGRYSRAGSS